MWGLQQGSRLLAAALRVPSTPRAPFSFKPPEHPLSAAEQVIALSAMFATFLLPTAWILGHVEHYKSRSE